MPGLVGQFPVSAFTDPQSGQQKNVSVIRGNDNTVGTAITGHDASATIHVQSSTLASRPAAGTAQRFWVTTDGKRLYFDNGTTWDEVTYVTRVGGAGNLPYGAVPGSPADGDVWVTSAGFFVRVAGVTIGPLAAGTLTLNTLGTGNASGGFQDSGVTDNGTIVNIPARYLTVGTQPRATAYGAPGTTVAASTTADVVPGTELLDVGAFLSGGTFTIPASAGGTYTLTANVTLSSGSGTSATLQWSGTGAVGPLASLTIPAGGLLPVSLVFVADLAAGAVVKATVSNIGGTNSMTIDRATVSVAKVA